jgi:hypothetical protein
VGDKAELKVDELRARERLDGDGGHDAKGGPTALERFFVYQLTLPLNVAGTKKRSKTTNPTQCPEQVFVLALVGCDNVSARRHDLHFQDLVGGQSVACREKTVAAATQVPTDSDGFAAAANVGLVKSCGC